MLSGTRQTRTNLFGYPQGLVSRDFRDSNTLIGGIDKWSPALQIRTVLLSIQALLSAPNPDDPLATDVSLPYHGTYTISNYIIPDITGRKALQGERERRPARKPRVDREVCQCMRQLYQ